MKRAEQSNAANLYTASFFNFPSVESPRLIMAASSHLTTMEPTASCSWHNLTSSDVCMRSKGSHCRTLGSVTRWTQPDDEAVAEANIEIHCHRSVTVRTQFQIY
ncbi:hypothetical protein MUK42_12037 [Musa troglodytarum]|uniref:Uncharacterized protein n=1 Tax=Musa troglodytarum TaxID=320322 RepID=A0A9E7IBE0_9LILI|nr:hypothetical protein MUK42_12037 [Musa troglodytarum]